MSKTWNIVKKKKKRQKNSEPLKKDSGNVLEISRKGNLKDNVNKRLKNNRLLPYDSCITQIPLKSYNFYKVFLELLLQIT